MNSIPYIPATDLLRAIALNEPMQTLLPFENGQEFNPLFLEFLQWNRLLPLFFHRLKQQQLTHLISATTLTYLEDKYQKNIFIYLQRKKVLIESLELFNTNGIKPVLLKGSTLAETIYENPVLRPMTDIDLLFTKEDLLPARQLFLKQGARELYTSESKYTTGLMQHLPALMYKGVMFEFHELLIGRYEEGYLPPEVFFKDIQPVSLSGTEVYILSPTVQLYHLLMHAEKHLHGSNRFIWLYDIYFLLQQHGKNIDPKIWDAFLSQPGIIKTFTKYSAWLRQLFGISLPGISPSDNKTDLIEYIKSCRRYRIEQHHVGTFTMLRKLPGLRLKIRFMAGKIFPTLAYIKRLYGVSSTFKALFYYPVLYGWYLGKMWRIWRKEK
jgi:hypothetical protein